MYKDSYCSKQTLKIEESFYEFEQHFNVFLRSLESSLHFIIHEMNDINKRIEQLEEKNK